MEPVANFHQAVAETTKTLNVPVKQTSAIEAITTSLRSIGKGFWALLAVLLLILIGTIVVSYLGWTSAAGTDVPASGYVALALGVIFSLAVGFGLMALVFYSSRSGYDEPARLVQEDDDISKPQP
jgi:hypothetical protein